MAKPLPDIIVRGEAYNNDVVAPISLCVNYPTSDSEAAICSVLFDDESGLSKVVIRDTDSLDALQVRAKTFHGDLWIPRLTFDYSYREHIDESRHGVAELLAEGNLQDFRGFPGTFKCFVLLQDNALFAFYDEEKRITWTTPFGQAGLLYDYRYGGYVRDMKERKPLKREMIEIDIDPTKYVSLYELITDLSKYLDDLMWLLSFFCKKYVFWYQAEMYYKPEENQEVSFRIIDLYRDARMVAHNHVEMKSPGFENHPSDLLIKLDVLRGDSGSQVFTRFFDSKDKDNITKTITYVLSTYADAFFEQDLGVIYTALEGLVNSYTTANILGTSKFDKLEDAIRNFIISQSSIELTDEQLAEIKSKLPELRRRTFTTRLKYLFSEPIKKITPLLIEKCTAEILLNRLGEAVKRRNQYIHQGKIDDLAQTAGDLALIRFLVSLYILELLNYPIERINGHDRDLLNVYWSIEQANTVVKHL